MPSSISPGEALYVVNRLLEDRYVSPAEITRYVAAMQQEISELETRLAELKTAAGAAVTRTTPLEAEQPAARGRRRGRRQGNPLAGRYMGYMRQIPPGRKPKYQRIKEKQGFDAAIAALKADLGR